jgi:hypothetical protein
MRIYLHLRNTFHISYKDQKYYYRKCHVLLDLLDRWPTLRRGPTQTSSIVKKRTLR